MKCFEQMLTETDHILLSFTSAHHWLAAVKPTCYIQKFLTGSTSGLVLSFLMQPQLLLFCFVFVLSCPKDTGLVSMACVHLGKAELFITVRRCAVHSRSVFIPYRSCSLNSKSWKDAEHAHCKQLFIITGLCCVMIPKAQSNELPWSCTWKSYCPAPLPDILLCWIFPPFTQFVISCGEYGFCWKKTNILSFLL